VRKNELAKLLSDECGLTLGQASSALSFIFSTITKLLLMGGQYHQSSFGTFQITSRKKRQIHNVNKEIYTTIPEKKSVRFAPSRKLKTLLNSKRTRKKKAVRASRSKPK
jgi:DNA-binding protein HU-beta